MLPSSCDNSVLFIVCALSMKIPRNLKWTNPEEINRRTMVDISIIASSKSCRSCRSPSLLLLSSHRQPISCWKMQENHLYISDTTWLVFYNCYYDAYFMAPLPSLLFWLRNYSSKFCLFFKAVISQSCSLN